MKLNQYGSYLLAVFAATFAFAAMPAYADQPAPDNSMPSSPADTKTAKDALSKLASLYQSANDLGYTSTITVYGPPPEDPTAQQKSVTILVTGSAEKPNKFSVKGTTNKKLNAFVFSDGSTAYKFDPVIGYYVKLNAPSDGADLPPLHKPGLQAAMEYATSFAARMFFDDQPYDISEATTVANADVEYSAKDQKIGTQQVTTITETMKGDNGTIDSYAVSLDKLTGLPRRVSETITTGGKATPIFTEDYDSIHVGSTPDDLGAFNWQPPAMMVMGYTPIDQQSDSKNSSGQQSSGN